MESTLEFKEELKQQLDKLNEIYNKILEIKEKQISEFEDIGFVEDKFRKHIEREATVAKLRYELLVNQEALKNPHHSDPNKVKPTVKRAIQKQILDQAYQEITDLKTTVLDNFKKIILRFDFQEINHELNILEDELESSLEYFKYLSQREGIEDRFRNCGAKMVQLITGINDQQHEANDIGIETVQDVIDHCRILLFGYFEEKICKPYRISFPNTSLNPTKPSAILSKKLSKLASNFRQEFATQLKIHKVKPLKPTPSHNQSQTNQESSEHCPKLYHINYSSNDSNTLESSLAIAIDPNSHQGIIDLFDGDTLVISKHGSEKDPIGTDNNDLMICKKIRARKGAKIILHNCYCPERLAEYLLLQMASVSKIDNSEGSENEQVKKLEFPDILFNPNHVSETFQVYSNGSDFLTLRIIPCTKVEKAQLESEINLELGIVPNLKISYPDIEDIWSTYCIREDLQFPLPKGILTDFIPKSISSDTFSVSTQGNNQVDVKAAVNPRKAWKLC